MSRVSIKVVGAQGQGLNSIGEVLAKGLKRAGYCVFGYREYNSLIKGGHSSYQIDVDNVAMRSTDTTVHVLVTLNHHGLERNVHDVKPGGIIIHDVEMWSFPEEDTKFIEENDIKVIQLPMRDILKKMKAKPILGNMFFAAFVWDALGRDPQILKDLAQDQYGHKGEAIVAKNVECIDAAVEYHDPEIGRIDVPMSEPSDEWKNHLLVTGSQSMGLGAIHGGMRAFFGYPMTPSSPLLSYIASVQKEKNLIIKQAEDEITAIQMTSGACAMGTRAMTATSGGGYDLMTESISMNGIMENPVVVNLAQRPGPGTGMPTWTAQGDLLMAVHSSHGEFPRCVISASDADDSFHLMPEAFNIAEEYQCPVVVLSDKHSAESLYTAAPFDESQTEIRRGKIITDEKELANLKDGDRYDPTVEDGISRRWLPGSKAVTFCQQADEHDPIGNPDEGDIEPPKQMEKRMRKIEVMESKLPDPELFMVENGRVGVRVGEAVDVLLVGWGSMKGVVLDSLESLADLKVGYLHYTYLWPLKTERFIDLVSKAKKTILIEGNYQGQLGMLLTQETGVSFDEKLLKYDGRPFFRDELIKALSEIELETSN